MCLLWTQTQLGEVDRGAAFGVRQRDENSYVRARRAYQKQEPVLINVVQAVQCPQAIVSLSKGSKTPDQSNGARTCALHSRREHLVELVFVCCDGKRSVIAGGSAVGLHGVPSD